MIPAETEDGTQAVQRKPFWLRCTAFFVIFGEGGFRAVEDAGPYSNVGRSRRARCPHRAVFFTKEQRDRAIWGSLHPQPGTGKGVILRRRSRRRIPAALGGIQPSPWMITLHSVFSVGATLAVARRQTDLYTKTVRRIRTTPRICRTVLFFPQRGRMSAQLTGEGEKRGSSAIVSASPSSAPV